MSLQTRLHCYESALSAMKKISTKRPHTDTHANNNHKRRDKLTNKQQTQKHRQTTKTQITNKETQANKKHRNTNRQQTHK